MFYTRKLEKAVSQSKVKILLMLLLTRYLLMRKPFSLLLQDNQNDKMIIVKKCLLQPIQAKLKDFVLMISKDVVRAFNMVYWDKKLHFGINNFCYFLSFHKTLKYSNLVTGFFLTCYKNNLRKNVWGVKKSQLMKSLILWVHF